MVNTTAEPQVLSRCICLGSLQPIDVAETPTSSSQYGFGVGFVSDFCS